MEPSRIPRTTVQTGLIQEERSFEWKINNFPVVRKHESMIGSQKFEFYAGESIGLASKWKAFLCVNKKDGMTWVGIYIRLLQKPTPISEHLYAQLIFTFKDKDGGMKKKLDTEVVNWYDTTVIADMGTTGLGFSNLFDINGELPSYMELVDGCLVVHISFNLFAPAQVSQPMKAKLEKFELKSTAKARADLPLLMGGPVVPTVKVIANDGKEFWTQKDVLSGRSPVFRAMLEADMTEGNAGVIEIQDMGGQSIKTMLHFMNRGELLPEWSSSEVLAELTNAAAKYELTDLLLFLDGVLGDVCTLANVGLLIPLANRLSLKKAEGDLLSFLRRKGVNSAENFVQVLDGALTSESGLGAGGRRLSCSCGRGHQGKRGPSDKGEETPKRRPPLAIRRIQN